jgi:putative hydrolase
MSDEHSFGFTPREPDDEGDTGGEAGSGGAEGTGGGIEGPRGEAGPGGASGTGGGTGSTGGTGGGSGGPLDPFGGLFGAFGGGQPIDLGQALQQLGRMLSYQGGGPVNWNLAREAARAQVAASGDTSVSDADRRAVEEAVRLAELWLDSACDFPASTATVKTWSRAEWVEGTLDGWRDLVEPVAERVVDAMGRSVTDAMPGEMGQMAAPLLGMLRQLGVSLWGGQVGQAIGSLAGEVVGSTDIGLPLVQPGTVVLLPVNARAYGHGLGVDERDVLVHLAMREAARHRLFTHAPWLRGHLVGLVDAFARGINVDTSRMEEALRDLDPSRPEALQQALEGGLFEPQTTPDQQAALDRLETALALVEGWVDDVVGEAARDRLASADALRETVRRRRATGGPAEQTFATLVGLQLRPRRLREAAALWAAIRAERGIEGPTGRDAVWAHPDLLPTSDELADPGAYLRREAALDLSALEESPPPPEPGEDQGDRPPS